MFKTTALAGMAVPAGRLSLCSHRAFLCVGVSLAVFHGLRPYPHELSQPQLLLQMPYLQIHSPWASGLKHINFWRTQFSSSHCSHVF